MPENILQRTSEVDFSTPQRVQIYYNEQIYDTTVALNNSKLEINFTDEKNLLGGAYASLTEKAYKITYMGMAFNGEKSELASSFLPLAVYDFITSFEGKILLDTYDKGRECFYIKKSVNEYFITLECYENEDKKFYSMEIK